MIITVTESVSQLIRRLSRTVVGPEDLTKAVLAELGGSPEAMYSALQEILPSYCRRALGIQRRTDINIPPPTPEEKQEEEVLIPSIVPEDRRPVSKKQQRLRDWYALQLEEQFATGDSSVPWKMLAQLTAANLIANAEARRKQVAGDLAWITRLESLADALNRYGAATVAELPEVVFTDIWKPRS